MDATLDPWRTPDRPHPTLHSFARQGAWLRERGLTWKKLRARRVVDRPEDYDALLRDQPPILDTNP